MSHPTVTGSVERTRNPLLAPDFILLVAGQGISLFGNAMLRFAMSMWVLDQTGSATTFAAMLAVSFIPTILLSPFGGVLADRMNRRTLMVALDALSAVFVAAALLWFMGFGFSLVAVGALQVSLAVLGSFETPTVQAALPQMLRDHGESALTAGSAVIGQVQQLCALIPSFAGGVLYAATGIRPMMAVSVVAFGAAAFAECFIHLADPRTGKDEDATSPLEDIRDAMRFLTHDRPNILKLMGIATVLNFVVLGYSAVGYAFIIRESWGFDATVYGVVDGIVGMAGVAGMAAAGMLAGKLRVGRITALLLALGAATAAQGLACLMPSGDGGWIRLATLTAFACVDMVACSFTNITAIPAIQLRTPDAMIGKVMALMSSLALCAQPLGQMVYGRAFDMLSPAAVFLASAVTIVIAAVAAAPVFRHFDD